MKRAGPYLHVVGLEERAAALAPELLQAEDDVLEEHVNGGRDGEGRDSTGFAADESVSGAVADAPL
jgi:hypothetical protein